MLRFPCAQTARPGETDRWDRTIPRSRRISSLAVLTRCLLHLAFAVPALAADGEILPDNIIFVTSTGYWEESGDLPNQAAGETPAGREAAPAAKRRGYYKLVAVRQPEGNMHVFLQQIALGPAGPTVVTSGELEEFSGIKAYVTDIRPEHSDGIARQPGLFATVYLKTDPAIAEPETWTVLVDDLGDIKVERATN